MEKRLIKERKMDINKIQEILPHRYPFLLIDRIIEFVPDESACYKMRYNKRTFFSRSFPAETAHARRFGCRSYSTNSLL